MRRALATAERSGPGRAFPGEVRARAIAYVDRRRSDGATDEQIARELGIPAMTFRRWVGSRSAAFRAVAVIEEAASAPLVVHGPRGLRVEGLDLDHLVELWGRLS